MVRDGALFARKTVEIGDENATRGALGAASSWIRPQSRAFEGGAKKRHSGEMCSLFRGSQLPTWQTYQINRGT